MRNKDIVQFFVRFTHHQQKTNKEHIPYGLINY